MSQRRQRLVWLLRTSGGSKVAKRAMTWEHVIELSPTMREDVRAEATVDESHNRKHTYDKTYQIWRRVSR